jgi:hypothetical protein
MDMQSNLVNTESYEQRSCDVVEHYQNCIYTEVAHLLTSTEFGQSSTFKRQTAQNS